MTNDIDNLGDIIDGASPEVLTSFVQFFELIQKYNLKLNLVAKGTIPRAGVKHFFDSYKGLQLIASEIENGKPIFDFGAGNGFPGIVAGIAFPNQPVVLVERDQRKAEFLKIAADELELRNVEVHAGSTTDLVDDSCFNVISRAMAPLPRFLLESRRVVAEGGKAFLYKSDHWSTEFSAVPPAIFDFWNVELFDSYILPKEDTKRFLVRCTRI